MITPDEALDFVIRTAVSLPPQSCPLQKACGLVLAEDVVADCDYPPFPRSMMDGFAVRLADAGKAVPVAGNSCRDDLARRTRRRPLRGHSDRRPCPPGTEAVVPKEQVRQQESDVVLPAQITAGKNIALSGSDCRRGQRVLAAGMRITPLAVGVLASFGGRSVQVIPKPRLGIITTGGELAEEGESLQPSQIRDSNGPMLVAMMEDLGIGPPRCVNAPDRLVELRQALQHLADADIVVLTGGVSVGTYDLVPHVLADIGAEKVFHGVRQKPGKPILFARTDRQLFFGLPGNPLACHLGFHRYVSAAIGRMSGHNVQHRCFRGTLVEPIESKAGRTHFAPGCAEPANDSHSAWRITPLSVASSADIFRAMPRQLLH